MLAVVCQHFKRAMRVCTVHIPEQSKMPSRQVIIFPFNFIIAWTLHSMYVDVVCIYHMHWHCHSEIRSSQWETTQTIKYYALPLSSWRTKCLTYIFFACNIYSLCIFFQFVAFLPCDAISPPSPFSVNVAWKLVKEKRISLNRQTQCINSHVVDGKPATVYIDAYISKSIAIHCFLRPRRVQLIVLSLDKPPFHHLRKLLITVR